MLQIHNESVIQRITRLAQRKRVTVEQIVAEAVEVYEEQEKAAATNEFWIAVAGIGDSGDPDLANRDEEILRSEIDPIYGWSPQNGHHQSAG